MSCCATGWRESRRATVPNGWVPRRPPSCSMRPGAVNCWRGDGPPMTIVRVGAGTGDPDLLTGRALDVLARAERIVVAEPSLLATARAVAGPAARIEAV